MSDPLSILISAGILAMMVWAVFRTGAANPIDTRSLLSKLTGIDSRLKAVESQIEDLPTVREVEGLRGDVKRVLSDLESVCEKVEKSEEYLKEKINVVDAGVTRIEAFLMDAARPTPGRTRR